MLGNVGSLTQDPGIPPASSPSLRSPVPQTQDPKPKIPSWLGEEGEYEPNRLGVSINRQGWGREVGGWEVRRWMGGWLVDMDYFQKIENAKVSISCFLEFIDSFSQLNFYKSISCCQDIDSFL